MAAGTGSYYRPLYVPPHYESSSGVTLLDFCLKTIYERAHGGFNDAEVRIGPEQIAEISHVVPYLKNIGYKAGFVPAHNALVFKWPMGPIDFNYTSLPEETEIQKLTKLCCEASQCILKPYTDWVDAQLQTADNVCFTVSIPGSKPVTLSEKVQFLPFGDPARLLGQYPPEGWKSPIYTASYLLSQRFTCRYTYNGFDVKWKPRDACTPFVCVIYKRGTPEPSNVFQKTSCSPLTAEAEDFVPPSL